MIASHAGLPANSPILVVAIVCSDLPTEEFKVHPILSCVPAASPSSFLMESVSVSGVSVSVALIIQEFATASQLFKKWRKHRGRSKAVGQAELESSLYFGESSIDKKRRALMVEHGKKFDAGDGQ